MSSPVPALTHPLLAVAAGDAIGAGLEFAQPKTIDFALFVKGSVPSDDTVLTLAVARAVLAHRHDEEGTRWAVVNEMRAAVQKYPDAGYGSKFLGWSATAHPEPYGSWANGAAMRVASVAWAYDTLEDVERFAQVTAGVTHNHPEGLLGARAVAGITFLARTGTDKDTLRDYAQQTCGYDLSDEATDWAILSHPARRQVLLANRQKASARYSVPRAIRAFLESSSLEEALRLAVFLGGDTDTQAAMTGAMAEAYYGDLPQALAQATQSVMGGLLWAEYEDVRRRILALRLA